MCGCDAVFFLFEFLIANCRLLVLLVSLGCVVWMMGKNAVVAFVQFAGIEGGSG